MSIIDTMEKIIRVECPGRGSAECALCLGCICAICGGSDCENCHNE